MRMMLKVSIPVEAGNAAIAGGSLRATIQRILDDLKPEPRTSPKMMASARATSSSI